MQAGSMRLVKFLSQSGVASRRQAGELVLQGRVAVNGEITRNPGLMVGDGDTVALDGKKLVREERKVYIMLHKPRGYTCSDADRHAEHLARELIDSDLRLFSAGRLDRDSEGLILFSNDGDFVDRLTHPRNHVCKRYLVTLARELSEGEMREMLSGVTDDGELLKVLAVKPLKNARYLLTLGEGRKREIRRLTAALGAKTLRLKRIAVGNLFLGDLPAGQWRELSEEERLLALEQTALRE